MSETLSVAKKRTIRVQRMSPTQWTVRDITWPDSDARNLRGYIELKDDLFEVMQLHRGFEWFSFPTLSAATNHFATVDLSEAAPDEHVLAVLHTETVH